MAIDPATFPLLLEKNNFTITPEDTRVLSDMEDGFIRASNIAENLFVTANVKWLLTDALLINFNTWYRTDLKNGTLWFNLVIPVGKELCTGTISRQCFFMEQPPWVASRLSPTKWVVSAKLRVRY